MASRGDTETAKLKANVQEQLNRLLTQLQDLEELRADLDDDEYETTRQETLDQMKDFEASLEKMIGGNMTLVDELGSVQLAIQAAIRSAFKTPEVIKMFAKREPGALRGRLASLEEEVKLGRISEERFNEGAVEILAALEKLGETLTPKERALVERNQRNMTAFVEATENLGSQSTASVFSRAGRDVRTASK